LWVTVGFAIIATVSGVIASVFAVSRMLAMLTDMKLVPHSHFGMPGDIQKHTLVYTIVLAMVLTVFFDLSRIASLGAIFYIIMDIAVHWGVLRFLRKEIKASAIVLITAIILDVIVLGAFLLVKAQTDMLVIYVSLAGMVFVFAGERLFLKHYSRSDEGHSHGA
ncbi:MAG: amino acid permease, partial [Sinomicrobium sp.]|nr:amino acid permease [Sinomicrobium sp.]